MTLIFRIPGFVCDMLIARIFGADLATDAFFVAFKISNFLRLERLLTRQRMAAFLAVCWLFVRPAGGALLFG